MVRSLTNAAARVSPNTLHVWLRLPRMRRCEPDAASTAKFTFDAQLALRSIGAETCTAPSGTHLHSLAHCPASQTWQFVTRRYCAGRQGRRERAQGGGGEARCRQGWRPGRPYGEGRAGGRLQDVDSGRGLPSPQRACLSKQALSGQVHAAYLQNADYLQHAHMRRQA